MPKTTAFYLINGPTTLLHVQHQDNSACEAITPQRAQKYAICETRNRIEDRLEMLVGAVRSMQWPNVPVLVCAPDEDWSYEFRNAAIALGSWPALDRGTPRALVDL